VNALKLLRFILAALLWLAVAQPFSAGACAVCYGDPNSELSRGLTWGIFVLIAVVLVVLSLISTFFVYVAKRSSGDKH